MAKPHDIPHHEAFQEHPVVGAILAELPAIDENTRTEAQLLMVMGWVSHNDM